MIHESDKAAIINAAFDATGVRFNDRSTALQSLLADGREITYAEDCSASVAYDGETLPLEEALSRFAFDNRQHVDARTLPREGVGTARPGILSKADFPDIQSRVKFIQENGARAWENLPYQNFDSKPVTTRDDWYKLSRQERVRRIEQGGINAFTKLPAAPKVDPVSRMESVAGAKINRQLLDKERKIRGGR